MPQKKILSEECGKEHETKDQTDGDDNNYYELVALHNN